MAVTRMLLSEDFRVVIHDSSVDALNEFVAELGPAAKRDVCYPICFDPSNSEAVTAAVARIDADAWPVYVLINNSGILSNTLVEETSIDEWRNVFAQNVDSAFLLSRALLPAMRKRKWGRIVNTCSLAGKTGGVTTGVAYSTTKGALQTLTFALARESAKDGITVNGIAPAYIRTPTVETYPEDVVDMLLRYIPVSRFCEPEEFAHVVRFLISPMSGFITGEIIGTFWIAVGRRLPTGVLRSSDGSLGGAGGGNNGGQAASRELLGANGRGRGRAVPVVPPTRADGCMCLSAYILTRPPRHRCGL